MFALSSDLGLFTVSDRFLPALTWIVYWTLNLAACPDLLPDSPLGLCLVSIAQIAGILTLSVLTSPIKLHMDPTQSDPSQHYAKCATAQELTPGLQYCSLCIIFYKNIN